RTTRINADQCVEIAACSGKCHGAISNGCPRVPNRIGSGETAGRFASFKSCVEVVAIDESSSALQEFCIQKIIVIRRRPRRRRISDEEIVEIPAFSGHGVVAFKLEFKHMYPSDVDLKTQGDLGPGGLSRVPRPDGRFINEYRASVVGTIQG